LILCDENFPDHKHEDAKAAVMGLGKTHKKQMKELIKEHDNNNKIYFGD